MGGLIGDDAFRAALGFGLAALAVCALPRRAAVLSMRGVAPAVAVVSTLVGLRVEHRLPTWLVAAMLLLALGEWSARRLSQCWIRAVVLVPGAFAVGAALPASLPTWMPMAAIGVTILASPVAASTARGNARMAVVVVLVSAAGVYACAPDTEHAKAMLGGFAAAAILVLYPRLRIRVGTSAVVGIFAWTATIDGRGRAGAVVGALACLGVLVLVPLADRIRRGHLRPAWIVVLVQAALVAYLSRVAGFRDSAGAALALAVPSYVAAAVVLVLTAHRAE